jgi:hypothetical protein
MRTTAVAIVWTILTVAATAAAQPALAPPGLTPAWTPMPGMPAAALQDREVSESTALAIAAGGTVASYGMLIVAANLHGNEGAAEALAVTGALGTLIAPSAGRWYARSGAWRGLGLRLAGVGTAMAATAVALSECPLSSFNCDPVGGVILFLAAAGLYIGGTLDDIVMAPRDARRHNQALRQVTLVPLVRPDDHGLGVAVAARF